MRNRIWFVLVIGLVAAGCGEKKNKCDETMLACSNKCDEDYKTKKADGTFDNQMDDVKRPLWETCVEGCTAAHDKCRGK